LRGHWELAIDLYCGVGLFTLPLARRFTSVVGVEFNDEATRFAARNLQKAELQNVEIVSSTVGDWLKEKSRFLTLSIFCCSTRPETGAENRVIEGILALKPGHLSYVSCDPATLARDLKKLIGGGYALNSIVAFDMFPQTHHVETVAHLSLDAAWPHTHSHSCLADLSAASARGTSALNDPLFQGPTSLQVNFPASLALRFSDSIFPKAHPIG